MKIFTAKLSPAFFALYFGRLIQLLGWGLLGLFVPIYLLVVFGRVELVIIYYLVGHLLYAIVLPFGVQFLNKIGLRHSLLISIFFTAAYYICLYFFEQPAINLVWLIVLAVIILTFSRLFFWLPFHVDLAKFTNKSNRGQGISLLWASRTLLWVILPTLSGFLISRFGYSIVFVIAIIIFTFSLFPFSFLPPTQEKYSWSPAETWRQFLARSNRRLVLANMANGAENAVGIIVWPIFIFQIVKGNYLAVGVLSSLIVAVTVILQLVVGRYTDKLDKRKMIHWGSALYASGWLAKAFVLTAFQVFVVGTYHNFTQIFKDTPFDALNYEVLADQGHYVDEFTVLKEMAVQLGKVFMLIFVLAVALGFGLNWTFALAALASLLINLL
jgi:YQGE family putative transporter